MTYNVFGGTLSLTQSINQSCYIGSVVAVYRVTVCGTTHQLASINQPMIVSKSQWSTAVSHSRRPVMVSQSQQPMVVSQSRHPSDLLLQ